MKETFVNKSKSRRMATVVIGGQQLPVLLAKLRYRCEMCNGELSNSGNKVHCKTTPSHRGFITKQEAQQRQQRQRKTANELNQFYTIKNGVVELCQSKD